MNPKIDYPKGNLNFFENQILSSSQITLSPQTDKPSFTMATGFRNSATNVRGMGMKKKSKDQGYLIAANGGGAQHTGSRCGGDGIHRRFML